MSKQCVVFVSDTNYAFPTFVAAAQARNHASPQTDVFIVMSEGGERLNALSDACQAVGVNLLDASDLLNSAFSEIDQSSFNRTTVTALGRLLLGRIIPNKYSQIIYIDGDTQVVSSLKELEDLEVPTGRFYAAADYLVLQAALEGTSVPFYFNSGVMKFERNGWIGEAAFDYFSKHPELKLYDQDALNIVGADAVIQISNRWNFPRHFLHLVDANQIAIAHYMSHPKPWDGVYFPWGEEVHNVYTDTLRAFPELSNYRKRVSSLRAAVYRYRSIRDSLFRSSDETLIGQKCIERFLTLDESSI